jgi:transcriptional regulator with XRE-family HTH domain
MEEEKLKTSIARNLLFYRTRAKLTQLELAEKLNYSDKSISKWERGEGVPDIFILCQLSELYGVTVNNLISDKTPKKIFAKGNKDIISLLAAGLVWLVAVLCYVLLGIFVPSLAKTWLAFVYAVPASAIVLLIFNLLLKRNLISCLLVSLIIWGIIFSLYLSFNVHNIWLLFIVGIPLQVLTLLWFLLIKRLKKFPKI